MIRIIQPKQQQQNQALEKKHQVLLQVIGLLVAEDPTSLIDLLKGYSIDLAEHPTQEQLTDELLAAIAEENKEFNQDLGGLILGKTLTGHYDAYDMGAILNDGGGTGGEGLKGGIVTALGGIGRSLGVGGDKDEQLQLARMHTANGSSAYTATEDKPKTASKETKTMMVIGFFMLVGLCALAISNRLKKQKQLKLQQA